MKKQVLIEKTGFINRFLDCVYADLNKMSDIELMKWGRELSEIIGINPLETLKKFQKIYNQSELVLDFYPEFKPFLPTEDPEKKRRFAINYQKTLMEHLNILVNKITESPGMLSVFVPALLVWGDKFAYGPPDHLTGSIPITIPSNKIGEQPEKFDFHSCFLKLFDSLNDFPVSSLNRCPICQKVFFNPTRRQKTYCTVQCQNSAGVRRFRKKKKEI